MRSVRFVVPLMILIYLACLPVPGQEWQPTDLEKLAGQPADIAPSAYQYRADRKSEENPPESWIGLMKCASLPFDKAVDVNAPALKKVLCGLIWEEVRRVRRVALAWNGAARRRPKPEEVVVAYFDAEAKGNIPTWWNIAVIREADKPEVSADGRTYTFTIPVDTFGLVVSVRGQQDASAYEAPMVRAFVPDLWKRMDLEIQWGFDKAAAASDSGLSGASTCRLQTGIHRSGSRNAMRSRVSGIPSTTSRAEAIESAVSSTARFDVVAASSRYCPRLSRSRSITALRISTRAPHRQAC